ncbi:MAG: hypothetical protein GOMPHAMPRED_005119 [Gomphillus americanus]|uniref:Exonuclease domain-containing protein n=1 Tax=Gomphillus americanus TaxID=1940652 RepID=A0A8H3EN61_9LECA|nr:MAG: hypothetical protein GOMPHAMPRED_005119 [Gomphillus americanus]
MFTTLGLFKGLPCPGGADCSLENCLFSHDLKLKKNGQDSKELLRDGSQLDGMAKASLATKLKEDKPKDTRTEGSVIGKDIHHVNLPMARTKTVGISKPDTKLVTDSITSTKPSPPRAKGIVAGTKAVSSAKRPSSESYLAEVIKDRLPITKIDVTTTPPPKTELLQPRTLPNPPATHPIRFKLLLLVHEQMDRLNKLVAASSEPSTKALHLTKEELITLALNEEQNTAIANPKVYANIMKNRVGALKKGDLKSWTAERTAQLQKQVQPSDSASKKRKLDKTNERVVTGLSFDQEVAVLKLLVSTQSALKTHSYVTEVPSDADIAKSDAGIKLANSWEVCDRCGCRFQAFPTRRENDGAITTGGSCRHHWGRLNAQPKNSGAKSLYTCCQLEQGQPGCEEKPTHVFKVSNPPRLASVIRFEQTPPSEETDLCQPVCFDCEMAYTSYGMELIRLTATAWPSGTPLLDVLVRPRGEVLDLNTRFSGVTIQQWTQAEQWNSPDIPTIPQASETKRLKPADGVDVSASKPESMSLPIVPSIQHARNLFFKLITPSTPLIGHALENDLIALRVVHPTIVDTVILYPHKRGLPLKNKLKFLVRDEIQWTIQASGMDGHDSLEDALAAGELVRHKLGGKWAVLQRAGWYFKDNELCSPESKT